MLTHLSIENLAVIESASLEFGAGLTVLTGETGAGKSMIIDAIHAILGDRMTRDVVRNGAKSAVLTAVFDKVNGAALAALTENGYEIDEDGQLLIQRTITAEGKSSCRIGGRPATSSVLRQITPHLVNIHGQHESYQLLSPNLHIHYIDEMGGLASLLASYQTAYGELRKIRTQLKSLQMDEAEKASRTEYLRYRIHELEQADLKVGEWEELTELKNRYCNSERIAGAIHAARELLSGGDEYDGAAGMLSTAGDELEGAQEYLSALHPLLERLRNVEYELEDIGETLRDLSGEVEYDPAELEQIEQRLDLLYRLSHKYGDTEEEMLASLEQMQEELSKIESSEETMAILSEQYEAAKEQAIERARVLSQERAKAAVTFSEAVKEQLLFLNMPGIRFTVSQERVPLNAMGCDQMEFRIAANPGEEPKPIAKIASGGELSRIMLSIKTVLSGSDEIDTLIFDEVDTGISGGTAEKVGLRLREVSKNRQVLCVTHLAQIAALADGHLLITKEVEDGRTFTHVQPLSHEGRCRELARIMGGSEITDLMLQNADAMLRRGAALDTE